MRAVRANGKTGLEQKLVRLHTVAVLRSAELPANLTELARPVSKKHGPALVVERPVEHPPRFVVSSAEVPPPGKLILAENVVAERVLVCCGGGFLLAPDELGPRLEPFVIRSSQRSIPER